MGNRGFSGEVTAAAGKYTREKEYWLKKLSGNLVKTSFPYDYPQKVSHHRMHTAKIECSEEIFSRLLSLSNNSDARLYIILVTLLVLFIDKYTYMPDHHKEVIIGAPVYKQDINGDFINTVLTFRQQFHSRMTFKELLLLVRQEIITANENQNYPFETLLYKLNIPYSRNEDFPLFDIAILLKNIHDKKYLQDINLNMVFSFFKTEKYLQGEVEYNSLLYDETTIESITRHFNLLIHEALGDVNRQLRDIQLLTGEGKKRSKDFNITRTDYPKGKTIHELFELQVEKKPHHIAVVEANRNCFISYQELNKKSNQLAQVLKNKGVKPGTVVSVLAECSLEVMIAILGTLKSGGTYLPIDPDYPRERIKFMLIDSKTRLLLATPRIGEEIEALRGWDGEMIILNPQFFASSPGVSTSTAARTASPGPGISPAYVIYTSGSTGKPKGVIIGHQALINYIYWAAKTYVRNEKLHFPLYTSIAFDLTITSIFTPLLTGNAVVVYGMEEGWLIERIIDDNKVGVLKLTPSHLRLIREKKIDRSFISLKRLILGGEQLETTLARQIYENFNGKIEIYNEYGPTEATVGCMIYKFDPGKDKRTSVPIGCAIDNNHIYILDVNKRPLPPGAWGEIYIGGDGLAYGYLNRPELTFERFINRKLKITNIETSFQESMRTCGHATMQLSPYRSPQYPITHSPYLPDSLYSTIYQTGDMARWLPERNAELIGRVDHQVKIRGFRVELEEVKAILLQHTDIKDAVVTVHERSTFDESMEKFLCAYIIPNGELKETSLREYLAKNLPDYMIPSYFVHLDRVPLTPNGKVDRRVLPHPETGKGKTGYAAPRNEIEKKLVEIWNEVLRVEKTSIGIEHNFFDLGGHSLNAIVLKSKIHKKLDVRIPISKIFDFPTIRGMANYLKGVEKDKFTSVEAVEKKEYYTLSAAQKRMYIAHQMDTNSTSYNTPCVVRLIGELDQQRLQYAAAQLIARHESLRTSFIMMENGPVQKVLQPHEAAFGIEHAQVRSLAIDEITRGFIRPFSLNEAPLLRIGLVKISDQDHVLMIDMYHIISDGYAYGVLVKDFMALYRRNPLPPLNIQYKDFSQWQNRLYESGKMKHQEEFWTNIFKNDIPQVNIPTDYPRPETRNIDKGALIDFTLEKALTQKLNRLGKETNSTLFIVLLAAYNILLYKYTGQEDIVVGIPVTGRSHADLVDVIGVFLNMLAIRSQPRPGKTFMDLLAEVKENTTKAMENQDYPFDELVTKLKLQGNTSSNPLFNTEFAMQDIDIPEEEIPGLKFEACSSGMTFAKFDLHFLAIETNDKIAITLRYSTALFKPATIEKLKKYYIEILEQLAANSRVKLADITTSHELLATTSKIPQDNTGDFLL